MKKRWRAFVKSWLSLKLWIKVWLIYLNVAFLGSLYFLDQPLGKITFGLYLASAPLLLGIGLYQRGITRVIGVGHIIPWMPLLVFYRHLWPQLPQGSPEYQYVLMMAITVGICLAFDFIDILRYLLGNRKVMGT